MNNRERITIPSMSLELSGCCSSAVQDTRGPRVCTTLCCLLPAGPWLSNELRGWWSRNQTLRCYWQSVERTLGFSDPRLSHLLALASRTLASWTLASRTLASRTLASRTLASRTLASRTLASRTPASSGSWVFGSRVFGSRVFVSWVFGSHVFGSRVFGSRVFGSRVFELCI